VASTPVLNYTLNTSVNVVAANSTSFTFSTVAGHLLYPASITFSAVNTVSGGIIFNINLTGTVPLQNQAPFLFGGSQFENAQWHSFLGKVGALCNSSP
jgi:hypothetical protein